MTTLIPTIRRHGWGNGLHGDLFDRFLEDFGMPSVVREEERFVPSFDVSETEKELIVKAELPGINQDDLEITLSKGILTIRGEKKKEKEDENERYHTIERHYGSFSRTMRLPSEVDGDNVDATYKDGVLRVTLPKAEAEKTRQIEINTSK